ncbi:MAG: hypothetical protein RIT45_741 [Pseudomonadota bacterium]|jgi:uncharacterized protein YbbC (DUF1343 family)
MLRVGAEVAAENGFATLRGERVAVLANPTSLLRMPGPPRQRVHLIDALRQAGIEVARLFGPEHGIWATAQDMIGVDRGRDPIFGLEVETLYGHDAHSLHLRPETLDGIDTLVFDVADVGARYYTYAATLVMALDAAARRGVRVVVLDRPNPLGGEVVEGNRVDVERFQSFVGWIDIPQRHGLTIGEIARLARREAALDVQLDVVRAEGWDTARYLDEQDDGALGPGWTPPSPNMPSVATAVVYPGLCLLEATNWSEGRGTTRPFEVLGAPGVPARALAESIRARTEGAVDARPLRFEPAFQKHARSVCDGVVLEVVDRGRLDAVRLGLHVIAAGMSLAPETFAWRAEAYEFVADRNALDLLMGGPHARTVLERGGSVAEATADFADSERAFAERVRADLLYPRAAGPLGAP